MTVNLLKQGFGVGYIALEESIKRSALGIMGVHLKNLCLNKEGIGDLITETFKLLLVMGIFIYITILATQSPIAFNKIRYLANHVK